MSFVLLLLACGAEEAPAPAAPRPPAPVAPAAATPAAPDVVGQPLDLAALGVDRWYRPYAADGALTVVVFWELWCPHCRREVPKLQAFDDLPEVQVVGLTRQSRDVADADVEAFLQEQAVRYAVGRSDGALGQRLRIRTIPAAVVVVDGRIVWKGNPAGLTEAQLRGWL